jgi:hypothetical protein
MGWYYEVDGETRGPVSETELAELARDGVLHGTIRIREEHSLTWTTYSAWRGSVPPVIPQPPILTYCSECGRSFPSDELLTLNNRAVCAGCKPTVLQRMAEGASFGSPAGLWRQGNKLVTRSETPFPDRCIKCDHPAHSYRLRQTLYWQHPAYYFLLLCNLLIFLIVILLVRRKAVVEIGLCEVHRAQRKVALIVAWCGALLGIVCLISAGILSARFETTALLALAAGLLLLLIGAIWGLAKGRTLTPVKIENDVLWATGAAPAFLDKLPEWHG